MDTKEIIKLIIYSNSILSVLFVVAFFFISKWMIAYVNKNGEISAEYESREELKKITEAVEEVKQQLAQKNIEYQIRYSKNYESAMLYSTEIIKNLILLTEHISGKISYIHKNKDILISFSRNYKENYFKLSLLIDGDYRNEILKVANKINSSCLDIIDKVNDIYELKDKYLKSKLDKEKKKIIKDIKDKYSEIKKDRKEAKFFSKNKELRNNLRIAMSKSSFF